MSLYFDVADTYGSVYACQWDTPGLVVVVEQVGMASAPALPYGTKFSIDPVSGDLIITQVTGPNAGKWANLTQAKWNNPL